MFGSFFILKGEIMGYYKKICMLSGLPVKRNDKVKVFFLVATGSYKSKETILVGNLVYPWSAFKIVAALSVDAIYKGYDKFEVVENIKSKIVLKYLQAIMKRTELTYENMFNLIFDGETFIEYYKENTFLSAGYVHDDMYYKSIFYLKEMNDGYDNIKDDFERYLSAKAKAVEMCKNDKDDSMVEELVEPEIGSLQQYIFGRKNPYQFIKKNINPSYTEHDFFNDFCQDIYFMDVMRETGTLLIPNMDLNEDISSHIKSKLLIDALEKSLNNDENDEYLPVRSKVKVYQEISIENIKSFYNEIEGNNSKSFKCFEKFILENKGKSVLLIKKENIKEYSFLSENLYKHDKDIMLVF